MSVKKMGSKLAQGVRQVKAQQAAVPVVAKETPAPSVSLPVTKTPAVAKRTPPKPTATTHTKPAATPAVRKAAKVESSPSATLHPSRVWPD